MNNKWHCPFTVTCRSVFFKKSPGVRGEGTPYNVLYGDQAPPERGTFFSLQDFSLLDVNENGREISHCRLWKDLKGLTGRFYSCVRDTKTFWLSDLLIFKRQNINYHLKGVTFANNRYKVIPFLSKILLRTPHPPRKELNSHRIGLLQQHAWSPIS